MPRATMQKLDKARKPVGSILKVSFNPKELTFSRSITWNPAKSPKTNQPDVDFGGGGAARLNGLPARRRGGYNRSLRPIGHAAARAS